MNDFAGRPHKKRPESRIPALSITNWLRGTATYLRFRLFPSDSKSIEPLSCFLFNSDAFGVSQNDSNL